MRSHESVVRVGLAYSSDRPPEGECPDACNGAGECVSVEVCGNGLCAAQPRRDGPAWPWLLVALGGLASVAWRSRRRHQQTGQDAAGPPN